MMIHAKMSKTQSDDRPEFCSGSHFDSGHLERTRCEINVPPKYSFKCVYSPYRVASYNSIVQMSQINNTFLSIKCRWTLNPLWCRTSYASKCYQDAFSTVIETTAYEPDCGIIVSTPRKKFLRKVNIAHNWNLWCAGPSMAQCVD